MNLKKTNGESFFNVINCFQICKKCLKLERTEQIKCTHVKSTAHWLSSKKIKELKQLYKASPEDAIREFGGVVVSDYKPALRKEEVRKCFESKRIQTRHRPHYLFTACDPNGGGPSQMSIVSAYFTSLGQLVVSFLFTSWHNVYGRHAQSCVPHWQCWVHCNSNWAWPRPWNSSETKRR